MPTTESATTRENAVCWMRVASMFTGPERAEAAIPGKSRLMSEVFDSAL